MTETMPEPSTEAPAFAPAWDGKPWDMPWIIVPRHRPSRGPVQRLTGPAVSDARREMARGLRTGAVLPPAPMPLVDGRDPRRLIFAHTPTPDKRH